MASDSGVYYNGSRIFSWVSDLSGLPLDQVNFVISQVLALACAPLFRSVLHPSTTSPATRHAFGLVLGLALGYFCFGMQAIHLGGLPALCYIVMRTQSPHIMQRVVLAVALTYLSCIHLHRQIYDYGSYTLDITGPLMVITQKVTSLAFNLHDGLTRPDEELTADQKYHVVRKMPTALEYFSYMFHFQGLMCGPIIFYRDYIDFIHGHPFLKHASSSSAQIDNNLNSNRVVLEPSPYLVVFKKVVGSVLCAVIFLYLIPIFPLERIKESEFVDETSLVSKFFYIAMVTTIVRFKYYHAWLLADAICNASGLGFNGFDAKGNARWDLISNVDVFKFELGLSMRDSIEQWNKGTTRWLRMVVYERTTKYRTLLTYALSALWHGFYPGYYLTFMSGALFTSAARSKLFENCRLISDLSLDHKMLVSLLDFLLVIAAGSKSVAALVVVIAPMHCWLHDTRYQAGFSRVRRSIRHYFVNSEHLKFLYDVATMLTTRVVMAYITFSFVLLEFWPSVQLFLHMYLFLHVLGILALWLLPLVMPPPRYTPSSEKPGSSSNGVISKGE